MPFDEPVESLIAEMLASGRYRALIWAGGYPGHTPHRHSDVDLYAVGAQESPHHWTMERAGDRRVELTAYTREAWTVILRAPYRHPKHHFTFVHGRALFDPKTLLPELRDTARSVLKAWPPASAETLAEMRNGVAIQRDKIRGFREKGMPLHLRLYAEGFALLACGLLATARDGYSVDAGKSLTRLLDDPECPADVKASLTVLLSSPNTEEMAHEALKLADRCLDLTGGPVDSYHGGIPR